MQQKEEKIAGHTAKHIAGHTAEHTTERNVEYNDEITTSLQENAARFQKIFSGCADIKMRTMKIGQKQQIACMAAYIEVTGGGAIFEKSLVGRLLNELCHYNEKEVYERLSQNALGLSDVTPFDTFSDAAAGLLTGDTILFIDGYDKALKIPDKGYPSMGISEVNSEKVIRGSNEGFTESVKANTALVRKRIRSPKVKVKEKKIGLRSKTNVDLMYMEDLIYPGVLEEVEKRLDGFEIDGVLDSGIIEQLTEENGILHFRSFRLHSGRTGQLWQF